MSYDFINELFESKMFSSTGRLKKYTAKDIADLAFLYFLSLEILSREYSTAGFAQNYVKKTKQFNNYDNLYNTATDLYILLHVLTGKNAEKAKQNLKNPESNEIFFNRLGEINKSNLRQYFDNISKNKLNNELSRRFLLHLQQKLLIDNSNYRNLRILVSDWENQEEDHKRLAMTRLLQALRYRAKQSELLKPLENLAKQKRYELKGVNNPEKTQPEKSKSDAWKKLASVALAGYAGYKFFRDPNIRKKRNYGDQ